MQWKDAKRLLEKFIWIDARNNMARMAIFDKMLQDIGDEGRHENP